MTIEIPGWPPLTPDAGGIEGSRSASTGFLAAVKRTSSRLWVCVQARLPSLRHAETSLKSMMIMQSSRPRRINFTRYDRRTLARAGDLAYHPRRKPNSGESWTEVSAHQSSAPRVAAGKVFWIFAHQPQAGGVGPCDAW